MTTRPQPDEYAAFYRGYVELVPESDVLAELKEQVEQLRHVAALVPAARESFAYAPGKWTIRQVVGHLGDGERVFGFRAFSFARADATPLPGFDEDAYVAQASSASTPLRDLVDEFTLQRQANLLMLRALPAERWSLSGTANGHRITVRALAFVMAGHVRHHLGTLRERYGVVGARGQSG